MRSALAAPALGVKRQGRIVVKKEDWKVKNLPIEREDLGYSNFFWDSDAEKIMSGHLPTSMDDKWFVYSENGWVYFVRSWTGHYIFAFQLTGSSAGGSRVISSWVNTNPEQYRSQSRESDVQLLNDVISSTFGI
ncbi:hypothetical protein ACONUD_07400 [Microbulbifer harenosus]|uniref:Uncharacterized protein n=1 Tax=Microbulbifer harenosus TaxID=2576840 RepID=A0ABY2UGB3_9GAMM|nr:hypothetical protein [Microbulbifer harenosus]TLM72996.1 hypothetical protein FDY93_19270 [Microbulbifer harenosus]